MDYQGEDRRDESWHLKKEIPLAIIAAILVQGGTLIWWGASLEARVEALDVKIEEKTKDRFHRKTAMAEIGKTDAKIEANQNAIIRMQQSIDRIDAKQDRILELLK